MIYPYKIVYYPRNNRGRYAVPPSKVFLGKLASIVSATNVSHCIPGQLGIARHLTNNIAPLGYHIRNVVSVISDPQVSRVYTGWSVAGVANKFTLRYRTAVRKLIRNMTGLHNHSPKERHISHAVPKLVAIFLPYPTGIRPTRAVGILPEALGIISHRMRLEMALTAAKTSLYKFGSEWFATSLANVIFWNIRPTRITTLETAILLRMLTRGKLFLTLRTKVNIIRHIVSTPTATINAQDAINVAGQIFTPSFYIQKEQSKCTNQ